MSEQLAKVEALGTVSPRSAPTRGCLLALLCMTLLGCAAGGGTPEPAPPPKVAVDANLREQARKVLELAMEHEDPVIRAHAIEGFKEALGSGARTEIVGMFGDKSPLVRFAAAMAVGDLKMAEARPGLLKLVEDPDPSVQIGAAFALHRIGDYQYSNKLELALFSPDLSVRGNACFALGRTGSASAAKVLRKALKDPAVEVRLQAAEGLWRLGQDDGLEFLVAAGLSGNPAHQMLSAVALASRGDVRVIQHVRAGLDSSYLEVQLVAARALAMLGSTEGYELALGAATSREARQRYLSAMALGAMRRTEAQTALAVLLRDTDANVRVAAAAAILQLR